jgi:hypothetical protein
MTAKIAPPAKPTNHVKNHKNVLKKPVLPSKGKNKSE